MVLLGVAYNPPLNSTADYLLHSSTVEDLASTFRDDEFILSTVTLAINWTL